jgi:YesN/AraC family two-component response regulator
MIVDDERIIRQGLRKVIPWEELGFVVVSEANSGKAALEAAARKGREPQVILTDIRMPDMSGLELISQLRLRFPRLRSVVISGYSDFTYAVEAIKLKVEDYILKPLDPEIIKKTFSRLHAVLDSERDWGISGSPGGLPVWAGAWGEGPERGEAINAPAVSASMGKYLTVKMKRAVEDHYGESDFCLGKTAELLKASYGYLSAVFSKYEQIGFSAYLRHYRMEKARDLLLGRNYRISEVALLVGYGNIHYFSEAFRREYGLSPRAYIIRMRGNEDGP